jgi:putative lipoprotein
MLKKLVLAAFAFLALVPLVYANDVIFTGQVTYRERIALPEHAELWVSLVALPSGKAIASAAATVEQKGQVPLLFTLKVRSNVISSGGSYGLVANIRAGGRTLFRNASPLAVDVLAPTPSTILVAYAPDSAREPAPRTGDAQANPLLDTAWMVTSIGGKPVLPETKVSLAIAPDRRAGGHGGCNNFFTEASFEDDPLQFGPVAGTKMACAADVMAQEAALFMALGATADYDSTGDRLQLLDAAGIPMVGLVRQR